MEISLSSLMIAASLALDALAVSICIGAGTRGLTRASGVRMGAACGIFQFAMPVIGYLAGRTVISYIAAYDHWVALILLAVVGGNMIKESFGDEEECAYDTDPTKELTLLTIAVATSIDALAVGASMAMADMPVMSLALSAGIITAALCYIGMSVGDSLGKRLGRRTELIGGIVLIAIGLNIVREHLTS